MAALSVNDPVLVTNIETAYINLMNTVQQNTNFYWVVASRQIEGVVRDEILGTQITSVSVRSAILGHQRRRIVRE
jgi:hypothetical protein